MRAVNHALAIRNLFHAIHKNGALFLEFFDHKPVVNDFLTDVNGRAKCFERDPDSAQLLISGGGELHVRIVEPVQKEAPKDAQG